MINLNIKNILLAVVFTLIAFTSVFAYELREPAQYDFIDVQMWYSNGDGPQKLATGVCYGPYKEFVNDKGVKLGDILRPCTMITYDNVNAKNDTSTSGGISVNLFSLMGFTGSVFQDPFNGDWNYGVGFSVTEIFKGVSSTKQLEKVRELEKVSVFEGSYSEESMSKLVSHLDLDFVRIVR